jgi:hypothetical protein
LRGKVKVKSDRKEEQALQWQEREKKGKWEREVWPCS